MVTTVHVPSLQLLYEHLLHHRCWQTAAIIKRDLLQVSETRKRVAVCQSGIE